MSALSNYLETKLIDHVLRNASYTSPATVYAALYTTDPGEDNSGTEVSGGDYARQSVTFGAPTDGVTKNSVEVTYPEATASWGTVSYTGILDANTGGNLLFYGGLDASKTVDTGDQFIFQIDELECSLD